ncbi:MAG: 2Fe-2S iron-sulfur cluster-binding protein [Planktothrix sp.]|uniref:2Fe-2S iron-sulfur cluster-binding protein n=1 Tax=Planktothrix sp. TaxID=3088171 RepID=UPI0038D3CE85
MNSPNSTDDTPAKPATIVFAKSGKTITCAENELILDVAEREGILIPSSCRSGNCGTCQQKLIEGQIQYNNPDAAKDLEPGMILTCNAQAINTVVIDA